MIDPPPQLDSRTEVVTPENIAFEYRAAGPITRLGAYLIDIGVQLLVVAGTVLVAFLVLMALLAGAFSPGVSAMEVLGNLGAFSLFLLWFLMQWFYGALFEYRWNGQTPGKRAVGLRVLQTDGRPINARQALLRNLARWVDSRPAMPFSGNFLAALAPVALGSHLLGFAAAALTPRHQRLGDLICGTMVVAEERSFAGKVEEIDDPAVFKLLETLPAAYVPSRSLAKALSHYIGRRRYFGPARRHEIARHVGRVLIERLNLPAGTDCDLLLCALYLRAFGGDQMPDFLGPPVANTTATGAAPAAPAATAPAKAAAPTPSAPAEAAPESTTEPATDWESVPLG
ncbi:MAG: RDD family protein [Planctomycetota bacterium]